jgi:uncharacterized membrane protein
MRCAACSAHEKQASVEVFMNRIKQIWSTIRDSLWFVPTLTVLSAVLLAIILIDVDSRLGNEMWLRWPRVFGAGAEGSRGMLSAIATSMITVAGVVFSITIVALAQTSTQYSSRILRKFMADRTNQLVLGVFVSIYAYCLIVLRTIRGGDENNFVPSLAVLMAIVLAFLGIGVLIYFIHHIARSLQASQILASVGAETLGAVEALFPEPLGQGEAQSDEAEALLADETHPWQAIPARRTGYIQWVDTQTLLTAAQYGNNGGGNDDEGPIIVRMVKGIGEFAIEGVTLLYLSRPLAEDDPRIARLQGAYGMGPQRTIDQDAAFGIRQIVDVALKALSPGINDSTTAIMCIDRLTAILTSLAERHVEPPYRYLDGELRVIARGPTFEGMVNESFDEIRRSAAGNVTVLEALARALEAVAGVTSEAARQMVILEQVEALAEVVQRTVPAPQERAALLARCVRASVVETQAESVAVM